VSLNPGQSFKLFVLLDDTDVRVSGEKYAAPVMHSSVIGKLPPPRHTRQYVTTGLAVILALFVAGAGSIIGINVANRQSALDPTCFTGTLTIEGSTAFSPITNQVAAEYMQLCKGATIVLTANGSRHGYTDLAKNTRNVPDIVMYDGALQTGAPNDGWPADISVDPVGVVIFAVVGNSGLPPQDFTKGLTNADIRGAFETPATPGATGGHPFAPTGRTTDSGTRQTFDRLVLNGTSNVEAADGINCDSMPIPAPPRFCLWSTTMDLLRYVNDTDDAIGYAEADALPFFPNVRAIPIGGYSATRDNALSGNYTFLATEHLLTEGKPTTEENDFLTFLSSGPMTAKLQGSAFVACSSLSSALAGDCT
jgi:ABC-type phosphate transport system substrate-binding protein